MIRRPPRSPLFPYPPLSRPGNTSEPKQKRVNAPTKRSNAPVMLTYDEWLAREHSFHRRLWAAERLYDQIPTDTNFIARDMNKDRTSTRLNSSHLVISYAVFC